MNDGTAETKVINDPSCFRIVTNEARIAEKFDNLVCNTPHFHGIRNNSETQAWNPQILQKIALGVTNLIADAKKSGKAKKR